ncbi:hypothetical protein K437DRAFT_253318 [Tilletiaria anomala UBC 951]|uniref:Late embryogenesis abundant protein LEA-2 subgroup domain-containing protein n=1 Tax=Tilletiaria anomala (strain ATCC 24038 / CBS 436.72 / UBC 951) TaxID=1037660 RepID=A0A066WHK8_TILAU|nr:uncharacterized protein K437DRAFT_253318 [Tilletiaria anomala UBC 951]KDN53291.1 hypothetical protein K437DRAFT_253318 [Tilletiaria anomala UBC 951]
MSYPFTDSKAQQSSVYPSYPSYPTYPQDGGEDGYGGNYSDHTRYPTNESDQAAYANQAQRLHQRSNSLVSDAAGTDGDMHGVQEKDNAGGVHGAGNMHAMRDPSFAFGPGGVAAPLGTYSEKSIWSKEDKRAFQERSHFAKVCGPIFCVVILAAITIISAVCLVFVFARPPNFALDGATVPVPYVDATNSAFGFNTTIDFSVSNPNSISATVQHLSAVITTKNVPNVTIGKGTLSNQKIAANTNTTIHFPLSISLYNPTEDPNNEALQSVATQCGWKSGSGSSSGTVTLNIKANGKISVLGIGIAIPISTTISPGCPSLSAIESAIGALSGNSDLSKIIGQLLSGSGRRALALASTRGSTTFRKIGASSSATLASPATLPHWFVNLFRKADVKLKGYHGGGGESQAQPAPAKESSKHQHQQKKTTTTTTKKTNTKSVPWSAEQWWGWRKRSDIEAEDAQMQKREQVAAAAAAVWADQAHSATL